MVELNARLLAREIIVSAVYDSRQRKTTFIAELGPCKWRTEPVHGDWRGQEMSVFTKYKNLFIGEQDYDPKWLTGFPARAADQPTSHPLAVLEVAS